MAGRPQRRQPERVGGLARLTGTSSKLDTETIVAAAYEAKRLPRRAARAAHPRTRPAPPRWASWKSLLGTLKSAVNGLRNLPGLLAASENAFESRQAFPSAAGGTRPRSPGHQPGERRVLGQLVRRWSAWPRRTSSRPARREAPTRPWPTPGTPARRL